MHALNLVTSPTSGSGGIETLASGIVAADLLELSLSGAHPDMHRIANKRDELRFFTGDRALLRYFV